MCDPLKSTYHQGPSTRLPNYQLRTNSSDNKLTKKRHVFSRVYSVHFFTRCTKGSSTAPLEPFLTSLLLPSVTPYFNELPETRRAQCTHTFPLKYRFSRTSPQLVTTRGPATATANTNLRDHRQHEYKSRKLTCNKRK